ncbi:MAG: NERD domain-containing protein [Actinobacteria bacterium]|nr:NERD domain-containing protein [Actinomycetota bacterium]
MEFWRVIREHRASGAAAPWSARQPTTLHTPEVVERDLADARAGSGPAAQAARLPDRLPAAWRVIHAIPLGTDGGDVDHLVIGPGGVFTINTKYHRGARVGVGRDVVVARGTPRSHVEKARREAVRVLARTNRGGS